MEGCLLDFTLVPKILISSLLTNIVDVSNDSKIHIHVAQFITDEIDNEDAIPYRWNIFTKLLGCPLLGQIPGEVRLETTDLHDADIVLDGHTTMSPRDDRKQKQQNQPPHVHDDAASASPYP